MNGLIIQLHVTGILPSTLNVSVTEVWTEHVLMRRRKIDFGNKAVALRKKG